MRVAHCALVPRPYLKGSKPQRRSCSRQMYESFPVARSSPLSPCFPYRLPVDLFPLYLFHFFSHILFLLVPACPRFLPASFVHLPSPMEYTYFSSYDAHAPHLYAASPHLLPSLLHPESAIRSSSGPGLTVLYCTHPRLVLILSCTHFLSFVGCCNSSLAQSLILAFPPLPSLSNFVGRPLCPGSFTRLLQALAFFLLRLQHRAMSQTCLRFW
ncbi:hypothetical protein C8R47DRAFT_571039 [Mycena vitilis]|nr:hypothetical protein C8R47DRAFT_571039 [Mycena vitilis]